MFEKHSQKLNIYDIVMKDLQISTCCTIQTVLQILTCVFHLYWVAPSL